MYSPSLAHLDGLLPLNVDGPRCCTVAQCHLAITKGRAGTAVIDVTAQQLNPNLSNVCLIAVEARKDDNVSGKVRTAEMSWREVEQARDRGVAVLIPMGSTEEHGPHTPTGDYMVVDAVTERVACKTGDVMVPVLPFSYSEYFRKYPGTISLQVDTMRALLRDTVYCVLDQGFRHVVLFNGHKGNEPILQTLIREFRRERGILIPSVPATNFGVSGSLKKELYGTDPIGHGAEPMGSKQMYLNPGLVNLDRVEDFGTKDFRGMRPTGLNGIDFKGHPVMMPINMEDITPPSGSLTDPRLASADKGERLIEAVVDGLAEFVQWFKTIDPKIEP